MPFCEIRFDGSPVMSSSWNKMRPESGRRTPVRQLKKVLLPAPFGPMIARISPRWTSKSTLSRAARPPKRTVKPSVRRTARGGRLEQTVLRPLGRDELAGRRKRRLLLRDDLNDPVLVVLDVE